MSYTYEVRCDVCEYSVMTVYVDADSEEEAKDEALNFRWREIVDQNPYKAEIEQILRTKKIGDDNE